MSHVEVEGLRLAFDRVGSGPALVLLHGAACDRRVWRGQVEAFSDAFTVVAWDAPGCGESADPPESFRMPEYGACLLGLIAALRLEHPHVLGHSWGSSLAFELYRQGPDVAASLILVGAYAGWAGSLAPDEVSRRLVFALAAAELAPGEFEPTTMPGLFSDAMPRRQADELAEIMRGIRPTGTRAMAHALAEADQRAVLPTITVPTLLLYGDADERSPLAIAENLHAAIPTATLEVLPGLGHECYLEAPTQFTRVVRAFLESCTRGGC